MRLYIKQKVFSWRDRFLLKTKLETTAIMLKARSFPGHKNCTSMICGPGGCLIEQQLWTWMPKYRIYRHGTPAALIRKEFAFLHPKYTMEGAQMGNRRFLLGTRVCLIRAWTGNCRRTKGVADLGRLLRLDVVDGWDEVLALAVVLTIDCVAGASCGVNIRFTRRYPMEKRMTSC